MNWLRTGLAVVMLLAATTSAVQAQNEISMTAKKYAFEPKEIRVKKGEPVKLVITSLDHDHGIKLGALHIEQKLPKGEAVTVEFTPEQTGTFPFECSHFCGLGHKKMKGQLIVE